jgi:hypothetical protein
MSNMHCGLIPTTLPAAYMRNCCNLHLLCFSHSLLTRCCNIAEQTAFAAPSQGCCALAAAVTAIAAAPAPAAAPLHLLLSKTPTRSNSQQAGRTA